MIVVGDNLGISSLQLGPDDKIYTQRMEWGWDSLGVINYPSQQGTGCNFIRTLFKLNGGTAPYRGFPQFLQRYYLYMNHTGQCQSDSIIFSYIIWPPADSLYWNFRDPASGGANVSNLNNPRHKFTVQGSYLVTLIARHKDRRFDTIFQTINIYESPAPSLGPDPTICQGDSITFDAGVCAGCTYLWTDFLADTVVSTSQTFTTGFQGIYTVKVINADGCKGYDTVQLFTIAPPIVTTNPLSKSICSGDSTQIALTANVSGTTFTWNTIGSSPLVSGFSSGTGDTINQRLVSTSTVDETVTYWITPAAGNCVGDSVAYVVTVSPGNPVSITIAASANPVCAGTSVSFTATSVNGGTTPSYQWIVNGINVGLNNPVFTYIPVNNDVISCVLTSSETICVTNNPAVSNIISMSINPNLPVSISISPSFNPVCQGIPVMFTATPQNEGSTPIYQWKVNGVNVGPNNSVFTYVPLPGDQVTCVLTSSETVCVTNNPATSNTILMVINSNLLVGVTISASANPVCQGTPVTFTATPVNGGTTPSFQWKVNGVNVGPNSPVFTSCIW
jgi:hypothetical protein